MHDLFIQVLLYCTVLMGFLWFECMNIVRPFGVINVMKAGITILLYKRLQ